MHLKVVSVHNLPVVKGCSVCSKTFDRPEILKNVSHPTENLLLDAKQLPMIVLCLFIDV